MLPIPMTQRIFSNLRMIKYIVIQLFMICRMNLNICENGYIVFQKTVKMKTNQRFDSSTNHLIAYPLHLADNALILGHRDSEWTGHGPILEQDIALSNIALDLIGQARNFYQYAAKLKADGSTEDTLAYLRDVNEF